MTSFTSGIATSLAPDELTLVLLAAVADVDDVIVITDAKLDEGPTIVAANPAFERVSGYRADEVLGQTPRMLQGPETEREILDELRAALEAGRPCEVEITNYAKGGTAYRNRIRVVPVRDQSGDITHFLSIQRDVTADHLAKQRLAEEAAIGHEIEERTTRIVSEVDPVGAARAIAAQILGVRDDFSVTCAHRTSGPVGEPVVATITAGEAPAVLARPLRPEELDRFHPTRTMPAPVGIELPRGTELLQALPLNGRTGTRQGLVWVTGTAELDDRSEQVVAGIAETGGYVVESAVMYRRERNVGSVLQRSLLANVDTDLDGHEVSTSYFPGDPDLQVGGDWYDVVRTEHSVVLMVGDVMGHGVQAAATMGELRAAIRSALRLGTSLPGALAHANEMALSARVTATMLGVDIDLDDFSVLIHCAGHLPPVHVAATGAATAVGVDPSPLLGAAPVDFSQRSSRIRLERDEVLLMYTDGLVERRAEGIDEGIARLIEAVPTTHLALDDLVRLIYERVAPRGAGADDTALLAFRRR